MALNLNTMLYSKNLLSHACIFTEFKFINFRTTPSTLNYPVKQVKHMLRRAHFRGEVKFWGNFNLHFYHQFSYTRSAIQMRRSCEYSVGFNGLSAKNKWGNFQGDYSPACFGGTLNLVEITPLSTLKDNWNPWLRTWMQVPQNMITQPQPPSG